MLPTQQILQLLRWQIMIIINTISLSYETTIDISTSGNVDMA